jgi:aminopeptidase N
MRLPLIALAATVALLQAVAVTPGAVARDRFYPTLGNAGFDVQRYDLWFRMESAAEQLEIAADAAVEAVATDTLSELTLDFTAANTTLLSVAVDGQLVAAVADAEGRKLIVPMPRSVPAGAGFRIDISYTVRPWLVPKTGEDGIGEIVTVPDETGGPDLPDGRGVVQDGSGGFFLAAQPNGAHTLFPSNDYPTDKAWFTIRVTAPSGMVAYGTGELTGVTPTPDGAMTWQYHSSHPVGTHVVAVGAGRYAYRWVNEPNRPALRFVLPLLVSADGVLDEVPGVIDWLEQRLGRYPFEAFGIHLYPSSASNAVLEAQTMVLMPDVILGGASELCSTLGSIAHEAAHMWFGNSVSIVSWDEKWLSEGHATYYQLAWEAEHGCKGGDLESRMESAYLSAQEIRDRSGPPAVPRSPDDAYTDAIYGQGALALYALEQEVGSEVFARIEREMLTRYADGNASTADFIALAGEVADRDLSELMGAWLCGPVVPPMPGHPQWTTGVPTTTSEVGATACQG